MALELELTDEQRMLQESAVRYLQDNYSFEQRQQAVQSDMGFSQAHWDQFAEMGWLAMPLPEEYGGFGWGATELMLLCEELGRHLVVEPFLESVVVAGGLLARATPELAAEYLPAIAEGRLQAAFAHGEAGCHPSLANIETVATAEGEGFRITGSKTVVANGESAGLFIVSVRMPEGVTLFAVPADAEGLNRQCYPTYDGRRACDLTLENVPVGANAMIGSPGGAEAVLESVVDRAQLAACAEVVGGMTALLQATQDYTSQRKQFGQPLSHFQVLRHRMSDMYIHLELTRSLLLAAAAKLDDEGAEGAHQLVSALKARTVKAGRFVSQNAVQLHGGIAMTDELNVGHYFKRIALLENWFGGRDFHLKQFSEMSAA